MTSGQGENQPGGPYGSPQGWNAPPPQEWNAPPPPGQSYPGYAPVPEERRREAVLEVVRMHFKPEFLNRLDDIVVFRALGSEELTGIVDIQVGVLARRLAARRLTLRVSDAAREWLALNGFDPVYGARPLRRLVQSAIGDQLAKALLAGEIRDGDAVVVDWPSDAAGDAAGLSVTRG